MTYFRSLNKHIAFLLLLIFSAVQVVQCVHHHAEDVAALSSHLKDGHHSSKAELHKAEVNCKVCDFIRHQQANKFDNHQQFALTIFNAKGITLSIDFSQSLFERCVHTWTNKGPPLA